MASEKIFENNSHHVEAFNILHHYRRSKFLVDVEIQVDDRVFSCHRVVLAATIPYFRSMFSSDMVESKMHVITIKDISAEAMEMLLDYAYTAKVELNTDNVQPLLFAASILQMDAVCRACEEFLTQYLSTGNCLAIRTFAQQHNCVQLMRSVDSFTQEFFQQVTSADDFLGVSFQHLIDLVLSPDLNISSETQVFETVMNWISKDKENRLQYLPQLLTKVRFCSAVDVVDVARRPLRGNWTSVHLPPDTNESPVCCEIVSNAMACQMVSACLVTAANHLHSSDVQICRPRKSVAGVIFCVGGRGTTGDPFRSIEAYDWRHDKWVLVSEMSTKRRHVGVVSANGKLYSIGGHDGHDHLSSAELRSSIGPTLEHMCICRPFFTAPLDTVQLV